MRRPGFAGPVVVSILVLIVLGCTGEPPKKVEPATLGPKAFVGAETCKTCHLEHYDSWKMTLHSRGLQDAKRNQDAIIVPIDKKRIRAELSRQGRKLKVPADEIYIPSVNEILYTVGSQWQQRFLIRKDNVLLIAPIQYNVGTNRWLGYHEEDWEKRSWILECGGCHATGVDIEKQSFAEPGVSCEACHGKGSWHVAVPKAAVFQKRQTIVNPAKLTVGVAVQICGSCHNRGKSTIITDAGWPVGYEPGKALEAYYRSTSFASGDVKHLYANEFSKGHHQQYIDWSQSRHAREGVTCLSCHYVHQLGVLPTRSQTLSMGSKQCFQCHQMVNNNLAHSIHSFGNCIGCHMPRIAKSAESGDIHSHVFMALLPRDTLAKSRLPNSCQTCHKHKHDDLERLQAQYDALAILPKPIRVLTGPSSVKGKAGDRPW